MLRLYSFLDLLERSNPPRVVDTAGVVDRTLLDQQQLDLVLRDGSMLDAAGDHNELAGIQNDLAVAQLNDELSFDHVEQLVFILVRVPDELAFHFCHFHIRVIDSADDLRRPLVSEARKLGGEIDFGDHGYFFLAGFFSSFGLASDFVPSDEPALELSDDSDFALEPPLFA
jgi:hypothetical protein